MKANTMTTFTFSGISSSPRHIMNRNPCKFCTTMFLYYDSGVFKRFYRCSRSYRMRDFLKNETDINRVLVTEVCLRHNRIIETSIVRPH